jgi:methylenetetrahydrofolate dehydrogenase (NADP+) / methenyltetrahydrofolate cyclohydrolase
VTISAGARLLDGAPIASEIRARVSGDVAAFVAAHGHPPGLAVVVCGRDAPSMVYLERILKACSAAGIDGRLVEIPDGDAPTQEAALVRALHELNADARVAGIIVQMPLSPGIRLRPVVEAIDPAKDIDGIHPLNAGLLRLGWDGFVPATAHAALEMLHRSGAPIRGAQAVVIGRSPVVGMPAAFMLTREDATVTVCHSKTVDLAETLRRADIVVVAAGRPGLVTGEMLKPGAVVIDVGINVVDGRIVGDVDFESARAVAGAITPVPGGVGPLTNALLLAHLVRAAEKQAATSGEDRANAGAGVASGAGTGATSGADRAAEGSPR